MMVMTAKVNMKKVIIALVAVAALILGLVLLFGGGSKDAYLNSLTSKYTGKKVYVGLTEATASGNILSQIMLSERLTVKEARDIIIKTFNITEVKV